MSEHLQGEAEEITVRAEIERHGLPVEIVTATFVGQVSRPELARRIAEVLEIEVDGILEELDEEFRSERREGRVRLVCIDLHFETESAKHHFAAKAKWERVHHWGCKKFKVAAAACTNLELHKDSPTGPVLNEARPIGRHEGCETVWMVKPGPENNG
jgi:hypothetical protein